MVANRQPRQGTITDLISGLLDKGYTRAAQPVLDAVARSTNSGLIQQRLTELDAEVARLMASGDKLRPDNPVLRALLADLEDTLGTNARVMDGAAETVQATGSDAAGKIQRQLALPGMTDAQLARLGVVWNRPDPAAVAQLVDYANSDAWAATLSKYGDDVFAVVRNQAIIGISNGWSPLRTAREIRRITQSFPAQQANNLMRTLQLTSYRDATAIHQNANLAIIDQVVRIAALDLRTCLSCVSQHGDVIWEGERNAGDPVPRVQDHHSGRCTSVVIVKGRTVNIQSGETWFASLPEARQRQQNSFAASPGKFDAFKSGQVTLRDFRHPYTDDVFGPMMREASLTGALKNAGA